MKSVLMSIKPEWVEKIINGEKTIEVRKTRPEINTPFKVYIYCTIGKNLLRGISGWVVNTDKRFTSYRINNDKFCTNEIANGKVVAEFTCDAIDNYRKCYCPYKKNNNLGYEHFIDNGVYKTNNKDSFCFETNSKKIDDMLKNKDFTKMCLTPQELDNYVDFGKNIYLWHISNLKVYDEPKDLRDFRRPCIKNKKGCYDCKYFVNNFVDYDCKRFYIKAPRSWFCVEELKNEN